VYGLREGVMEDPSNDMANLLKTFFAEADKICDVHVVPHGQEPPTQSSTAVEEGWGLDPSTRYTPSWRLTLRVG
jgi:hypothetical protein